MTKPWEYRPKSEELQDRAAFRFRAATSGFQRLAMRSLRQRGIDPAILSPSRALEDNEPGTDNDQFKRTVKRLTGMGMEPDEAVKQVRRYLGVTASRVNKGMVRPRTPVQPGLDAAQQGVTQPPVPFRARYDDKSEEAIQQFRSDLTEEGYEPWMIDAQLRGQIRLATLITETRTSFPTKTPPGTTIESIALERLNNEMGDLLVKATPKPEKGLFSKVVSVAFKPFQLVMEGTAVLGGVEREQVPQLSEEVLPLALTGTGAVIGQLEKTPAGGPLYRNPRTGKTAFEEGAEISRPVVQRGQEIVGEPFEQVGKAGIPIVSTVSAEVSEGIRSQIVEDIATEVINPAALALVAPFALQAASGLRGVAAAEALVS
ncbi:hypothetical protein LCGC14_2684650, partial [marine sediment metagenome]